MMKHMKKLMSFLLACLMLFVCGASAFADSVAKHTITITNEKSGHSYEAYQVFTGDLDSTKKILSNIKWGLGVDGDALLAELIKLDTYSACKTAQDVADILQGMDDDSESLDQFARVAANHLAVTAAVSTEEKSPYTMEVTGDGYYLVKDADGTVTAEGDAYTKFILQVVSDVELEAKAGAPTLTKKIVEETGAVDANNGAVGDTVEYELTSKVPNMDGYNKYFFVIHDTLSEGLTFDSTSVAVTVGDLILDSDDYQVVTETQDDGCNLELILKNFIQYKDLEDKVIRITYSATINENAVIGNSGNLNAVHLQYSNNPNETQVGDTDNPDKPGDEDETGETPDDFTVTYVTGIELFKVDDTEEKNPLVGAKFEISGERLNKVKDIDGVYTEAIDGKVTAEVNAKGVLHFKGLSEGTYVITEITAPDGYNLLEKPITVVISCVEPENVTTGEEIASWKYELSGAMTADEATAQEGVIKLTVVNKAGAILPSTGGMGTTVFYMVGSLLVIAALAMLITKRRMNAE